MNHATLPYATRNDTTNPIARTIHPWASIFETPIGFPSCPRSDLYNVYKVAAAIVGIDRKNENSRAAARDIPGNTADRIWHAPIHTACPRLVSSMCHV